MNFEKQFEQICGQFSVTGASLVVVQNNKIVKEVGYGFSSIEKNAKVNKDLTVFRIASISKLVIASSVMQLVEKGLVDLDKDISDYFGFSIRNPKFPDDKITTRMLMTHTSSITDGDDDETLGYNGVNGTSKDVKLKELLVKDSSKYWSDTTFSNKKPGTNFIYSNFGTGVLACIVELVAKTHFTTYARENVLLPMGLDASFRPGDIESSDIASTYVCDSGSPVLTRDRESFLKNQYPKFELGENYRGPAGGLFINMYDLSKIMMMLMNKGEYNGIRILKEETIHEMMSEQFRDPNSKENGVVKGLIISILEYLPNMCLYGHTGSAYGVNSFLFFEPKEKFGVCFIVNGMRFEKKHPNLTTTHEAILNLCIDAYYNK